MPVSNAEIVCYEEFYDYGQGRIRWEVLGRAKTNTEGKFGLSLSVADRTNVWVAAYKQGLALGWEQVAYDSADLDFMIRLAEPSVLAGTVVDEMGRAIANAKVRLCLNNERMGGSPGVAFQVPRTWYTTETDAEGRFSFNNIPPSATADFWVEAPGRVAYWTFWEADSIAGIQFAAGRKDIRIVLKPEAEIQGQVVDDDTGKPVAGIQLLARPNKGYANYSCADLVVSGDDGRFCFKGMPADAYSLQVVPPTDRMADWAGKDVKVTVGAGQTASDVKVPVSKGAILEVAAHDTSTNEPIEGISVYVNQEANFGRHSCYSKLVVTDANGIARFRVPAGECRISVWDRSGKYGSYRETEPMTVAKGRVTQQQISLDPQQNPRISGTVRDEAGQAVAGAVVASKPVCDQAVRTGADGKFEVTWNRRSNVSKKFLLARHIERNLAGLIEIKGEPDAADITVHRASVLSGKVLDPNGRPIPLVAVSLRAFLPGWVTNVGGKAYTGVDGVYQISAVPPPQPDFTYRMEVGAEGYGPLELLDVPSGNDPAEPVEIQPIVLQPADQSISGVVVDAEGEPAAGIPIFLSGPRGSDTAGQPSRKTVTDAQGRFFIDRICKGPLRIQAGFSSDPKGVGLLNAQGSDQNVKVILGQEGAHVRHISLVGKSLSDLKELQIDLPPQDFEGKMILVCFWDMEQRPSRYCITQLAKQTEQIKQKGVIIVAVQASKIDASALKEWVEKYNITFPVGTVEGDVEKTKFAWGVRSLPWLILANRSHIVTAEGFSVSEINDKIKEISDAKL